MTVWTGLMRGAAADAAGTTVLEAVTYLDMAVRGRPASSTPEDTVQTLSEKLHLPIPGDDESRRNRMAGLGPLAGVIVGNGPMTLLGVTDPRQWTAQGWLSDVVPHVAYGVVTTYALREFDVNARLMPPRPRGWVGSSA